MPAIPFMGHDEWIMVARVLAATGIGALIGFERTFHGRPAGIRTHALVCITSALLMLVTVFQQKWMTEMSPEAIRTDPQRMAQGIMTGIGFLGAGVIFKEGLTVRGLTTAASIWVTSALGILVGIGFYFAAILGSVTTLGILAVLRAIEQKLPSEYYAQHILSFEREAVLDEKDLRALVGEQGFDIANLSYRLTDAGRIFEYRMMIRSRDREASEKLARKLRSLPNIVEFRIAPTGD